MLWINITFSEPWWWLNLWILSAVFSTWLFCFWTKPKKYKKTNCMRSFEFPSQRECSYPSNRYIPSHLDQQGYNKSFSPQCPPRSSPPWAWSSWPGAPSAQRRGSGSCGRWPRAARGPREGVIRSVQLGNFIQSWALPVFFHFFNNKKWFFCIFIKLITYFCTSPIKKALSQSN